MRIKSLLLALPLLLLAACDDEDLVTTTEETPPVNDNIIDVEHEVAHFSTLTRSIAFMPNSVADNMRSAMPGTAVSFRLEGEMLFQNVPIISHGSSDIFNDLCLVMNSDSAFMLLDGYPDITTLGNPDAAEAERADNAAARQTEWERFISYLRSQGRLEWEYNGGSAVIGIKDEFFQDYADSVYTAGGRMATVVNTRERLEELLPRYANGSTLRGIDFSTSSFVYDSDTIIYTVHSDQPDWMTTYMVRGLSGNYSFQYYVSTQRADNATSDDKRRFIIGIVTEKLPDDAEVYVDKTLNYIDSTVHVYPHALSDLPLAE